MRELPMPVPSDVQLQKIEIAVRAYRDAASLRPVVFRPTTSRSRRAISATNAPELPGLSSDTDIAPIVAEKDTLRHLHWRMDAAVLGLYNLPRELERRLLDYFSSRIRGRVPFDQTEYIPIEFSGINTLAELLAITGDWSEHNERRSILIEKEYEDVIVPRELKELERLQNLAFQRRQLIAPYPLADVEQEIERLKREGKWDE